MPLPAGLRGPVKVALARTAERIPAPGALPGGCRYEPKWDGYRVVVVVDDDARLYSRRGTDMSARFPEVTAAVAEQVESGTVLDGELVIVLDGELVIFPPRPSLTQSP
jgi:ATP-dependent DNA ligase